MYACVVASVAAAVAVRLAMSVLDQRTPFITLFVAVTFSAWIGGWRGGLLATALSALSGSYFFLLPTQSLAVFDAADRFALTIFVASGVATAALGQALLNAIARANDHAEQAERNLAELEHTTAAIKQSEAQLAASEERLRLAVDGGSVGTWHWDLVSDELYWSDTMKRLLGRPTYEPLGYESFLAALHPDDRTRVDAVVRGAVAGANSYDMELRVIWPDGSVHWQVARGRVYTDDHQRPVRMEGIAADITARREAEESLRITSERERLLVSLGMAMRATTNVDEIQQIAVTMLGEAANVDRCYFTLYDADADLVWIGTDYRKGDIPSVSGEYRISDFNMRAEDYYPDRQSLVVADVQKMDLPAKVRELVQTLRVRASVGVPIYEGDRIVATLTLAMADEPRDWQPEDVALAESVAAQTRSAVEVARLLAQARDRADHEALVNAVGHANRSSSKPETIRSAAVESLLSALALDRTAVIVVDGQPALAALADATPAGVATNVHPRSLTGVDPNHLTALLSSETRTMSDVTRCGLAPDVVSAYVRFGIKAAIQVPILDNGAVVAAVIAAMCDSSRIWTQNEIRLVEAAAVQMRAAIESARIMERERSIATTLQNALVPADPAEIEGLQIAAYYEPAIRELSIGGDFYDVFAIEKGCYALVVGDVSGKGLAAAAQVATVRNMTRMVMYQAGRLNHAMTELNRVLSENDLLEGFVTLFAGVYEVNTRTLTYVSCGHEPALIRRNDGSIEQLLPTGLPLGVTTDHNFTESTLVLSGGDLLLLYTDGITEEGPTRQQMLEVEGLSELVRTCPSNDANGLKDHVLAGVQKYTSGHLRDDACLVAVRVM